MTSKSKYILFFDPGTINMSYCLVEIETERIIKWGLFSIKDSSHEGSCRKLAEHLDTLQLATGLDIIIVYEAQPRCNVKTIIICGQLLMYYVLDKMSGNEGGNIEKIVSYHAKNKIKYYEPEEGDEPLPSRLEKIKKGHYRNKQVVIEHCRRVLKRNKLNKDWVSFFENSVKADDLSDGYISSLSYLKTNKLGKYSE